jgi:TIR domain/Tetratricopeptide repeat/NB-ARC domain
MVDFFVSHAGPDVEWAEWVARQLEDAGYRVELDVWEWSAGTDLVAAMEHAVERAGQVVAVWTPAYFGRTWTGVEARVALARAQDRAGWLVPVVVEPCHDRIPVLYRTLLRIDLVGLSEQKARTRLLEKIRPAGRPAGPVAFPGNQIPSSAMSSDLAFPGRLPAVWGPVPGRNAFFTGREPLLDRLHSQLVDGSGQVAVAALHGFGGVGKTQLAVEYVWRYAAEYGMVWWVDAETSAGLAAGLAGLARELGVASGDVSTCAAQALAELGRRDGWLLVYDNVSDPVTLARALPPATGHLIVTCRDPAVRRVGADLVEVGEFTREESLLLLRRHIPDLADGPCMRLAKALGDLPLAVDQAGAFLAETGMDPNAYLALLAAQPDVILNDETLHHPGLAATVTAAHSRLAVDHPTAARLLDQLAFLAPEPIPLAAVPTGASPSISNALIVADAMTTHTSIAAIIRFALARRSGTSVQIHRLAQALLRANLTPHRQREALGGALRLLASAQPGDAIDPTTWPAHAALTPHVTAAAAHLATLHGTPEPEEFRRLLNQTCWYLTQTGQHRGARLLAESTRARWSEALGDNHPDCLTIAATLVVALTDLCEHHAARIVVQDLWTRRRRRVGDDHPHTLACATNLAIQLAALGKYQAARELAEDTLTRRRQLLGDDHPDALISAANLAFQLAALGERQAARELVQDTWERRRRLLRDDRPNAPREPGTCRVAGEPVDDLRISRLLGDDVPDILTAAANLAAAMAALGEHQAAREVTEDTLERRRRLYGDDHPHTLASAANLAVHLNALGEHQAVRELAADTLARRRRVLGDDHPHTLASAANLAAAMAALGEHHD